jgi:lipid A 3-O-deacylase
MKYKKLYLLLSLLLFFAPVKSETEYTLYSGTFDTIDKEGDEKATLYGFEHNNPILFRETFIGKFSPITGGFVTNKSSIYLYTGVQAEYEVGPLNIVPSFAPGYYEAGDGKDLGMALEFKSEIKLSFDIFQDSKIGYSYSHISNNDWGTINPGTNNQTVSFSKTF